MKIDVMWPVRGLLRLVGVVVSAPNAHIDHDRQPKDNQDGIATSEIQQADRAIPNMSNPLLRTIRASNGRHEHLGTADGNRPSPAPTQAPHPVVDAPGTPAVTQPCAARPAESARSAVFEPKVFDRSPRAARMPWLLPVEPSVSGIIADQARIGDLDVRAVSIVGASHRCEEPVKPRQDSYRLGRDRAGRYLIVAVADGMSDSLRSDLGATVASRCAVDTLRTHLDGGVEPTLEVMKQAFRTSAGAMVAAANNAGLSENDVRCALIVAVISTMVDTRSGKRHVWFATLADVSAWLQLEDDWYHLAGDKKNGDLDSNSVRHFLPYHPDHVETVCYELEPRATMAVVTDGVGDAFTDVPNAAKWFAQRWERPVPLESFLLDVGYHASAQLDDRTSVMVWCDDGSRSSQ